MVLVVINILLLAKQRAHFKLLLGAETEWPESCKLQVGPLV